MICGRGGALQKPARLRQGIVETGGLVLRGSFRERSTRGLVFALRQAELAQHKLGIGRFEQRSQQIKRVFDEYRQWVHDTLTTEPQPWIQVLAGVCHPDAGNADVNAKGPA